MQIRQVNEALAKLDDGKSVFFMDLGPKLLTPEGKFTEQATDDGVLLNPKGYMIWAEAITPKFEEWLGTPITRYKLGMKPPKKAEPAGGVSGAKPAASQPAEDE